MALVAAAGCQQSSETVATQETADQFVERLNQEMVELGREVSAAAWTYATYISPDTELLNAKANERWLEYF
ncbi:M2 family metallopeptidase, partial [Salmonella enterica]|uniref:M2 family metallopeptidase n=1 Tax=Salmonella enterica TaxID=28901 RepID=UPI0032995C16